MKLEVENKYRVQILATVTLATFAMNGISLSTGVDEIKGKTLNPLDVLSEADKKVEDKKESEDETYYVTDNGSAVSNTTLMGKGVKEDVYKEKHLKQIAQIVSDYEPSKTEYEVEADATVPIIYEVQNEDDKEAQLGTLQDAVNKYEVEEKQAVAEKDKKEKEVEGKVTELQEKEKELTDLTTMGKEEDIVEVEETDEVIPEETDKNTEIEKELASLKEAQEKLQNERAQIEKDYEEHMAEVQKKKESVKNASFKVVAETVDVKGNAYVQIAVKETGDILGWVSKGDIKSSYNVVKEEKPLSRYYKKSEGVKAYSNPVGSKESKEVESGSLYIKADKEVVMSDDTKWLHDGVNNVYYLSSDLEDVTGKELILEVGEDFDLSKYGKTKEEVNKLNAFTSIDDLHAGDRLVIEKGSYSEDSVVDNGDGHTAEFIKSLLPYVSDIKSAGLLPSVTFGQAILESAGGTSKLCLEDHNLFGIKGTYKGSTRNWATNEDYGSGMIGIRDNFRVYPSVAESIFDYVDLITTKSNYAGTAGITDPREAITNIWSGGYATDPNYIQKVMDTIVKYNLTQYDV